MNVIVFCTLYLIAMFPTYFWRGVGMEGILILIPEGGHINAAAWTKGMLALSYIVLSLIAYLRGVKTNRPFLALYPVIGGIFDVLMPFVVGVPSVMNGLTLIFGILPKCAGEEEATKVEKIRVQRDY